MPVKGFGTRVPYSGKSEQPSGPKRRKVRQYRTIAGWGLRLHWVPDVEFEPKRITVARNRAELRNVPMRRVYNCTTQEGFRFKVATPYGLQRWEGFVIKGETIESISEITTRTPREIMQHIEKFYFRNETRNEGVKSELTWRVK